MDSGLGQELARALVVAATALVVALAPKLAARGWYWQARLLLASGVLVFLALSWLLAGQDRTPAGVFGYRDVAAGIAILMVLFAGYSWRLIGDTEDPEAATLEVHGHHVYHRQADSQFQVLLTLTVGQERAVMKADWCVTVVGAGGTPTCVYDSKSTEPEKLIFPQQGLALAGVVLAANTAHSGALNMRFNSVFPDPDSLRGATLTVAVPAARGHILPTSYIWPQFAG